MNINDRRRFITAGIECRIVDTSPAQAKSQIEAWSKTNNLNIAERIPISVGYMFKGNFKYYFAQYCLKNLLLIY